MVIQSGKGDLPALSCRHAHPLDAATPAAWESDMSSDLAKEIGSDYHHPPPYYFFGRFLAMSHPGDEVEKLPKVDRRLSFSSSL